MVGIYFGSRRLVQAFNIPMSKRTTVVIDLRFDGSEAGKLKVIATLQATAPGKCLCAAAEIVELCFADHGAKPAVLDLVWDNAEVADVHTISGP